MIKDGEGKVVTDEEDLTDEQLAEKGYTKEEVPYNSEEVLNTENYIKSKEKITERLKEFGIQDYEIMQNEENGEMLIRIPESDTTDSIVSNIAEIGKFEIVDADTQEVLMDNNDIKTVNAAYGSSSDSISATPSTVVYLNIDFNESGAKKLKEISNKYVSKTDEESDDTETGETETENTETENTETENTETENTETENTETENTETENTETEEKKVTLKIDNEEMISTSFDQPYKTGNLQLTIGQATTDTKTLEGYIEQASNISAILNTGNIPVKYSVEENKYILSEITNEDLIYIAIAIAIISLIGIIILVIKYKTNGVLAGISFIGLLAVYLLAIRYTNVVLSIQGIFGIIVALVLNYIFNIKILSKIKNDEDVNKAIKEAYKEFFIKIIPICIAIIVFCFVGWTPISSFGMVMFYGIVLIALYNFIITNSLLKLKENK